jgi:transcriptional regulator with XRE-family HTH domain
VVTLVSDPQKTLGETIKRQRLKLGMTQEELAEAASLHWTFVSRLERGLVNVSLLSLIEIAAALKLRVRDLVKEL